MRTICLMILIGTLISGCAVTDRMDESNDLADVTAVNPHPSNRFSFLAIMGFYATKHRI
ncbi:MAG: hypothetical protein ACI9ES_000549 [Oceanospirillaceae bacterium]|jgi:hypothetical protein